MKRRDQENDPTSPPDPRPSPAGEIPRVPFDPPIENPAVVALLKGLGPSVTPPPLQVSVTDGEISAQYVGGPRAVPHGRDATDDAEGNVVLNPNGGAAKGGKVVEAGKLDTTFRIRRRDRSLTWPIAVAIVVVGGGVAAWLGSTTDKNSGAPPTVKSAVSVAPRPAQPFIPPPVEPTASSSPASAPTPPNTAATPTVRSTPPTSSSPQPPGTPDPRKRSDIDPGTSPF
jgi:hypothetical protein